MTAKMAKGMWGLVLVLLLALAAWELGSAFYVHAKAHVAQLLIATSWQQRVRGHAPAKPWSWADTHPIGRLVVKRLGIDQYVLAGGSGYSLAFGPGHHDDSVYPGELGKAVISGHRDTFFTFLEDVQIGDRLDFQDWHGVWQQYTVSDHLILNVKQEQLILDAVVPTLALVTCYPFDALTPGGPLRYVVFAERQS